MALKVIIPPGQKEITVNGLYQWDYGQKLEIHMDHPNATIEVHFFHPGMKDAIVHACNLVSGVATVAIPDTCLEQESPITAWVCEVGTTSSTTVQTLTLPIIPRARPQRPPTDPQEYSDKYTEAVEAMNDLLAKTEAAVEEALAEVENTAQTAAQTATQDAITGLRGDLTSPDGLQVYSAFNARNADLASKANEADFAGNAIADEDGNVFTETYVRKSGIPKVFKIDGIATTLVVGQDIKILSDLGSDRKLDDLSALSFFVRHTLPSGVYTDYVFSGLRASPMKSDSNGDYVTFQCALAPARTIMSLDVQENYHVGTAVVRIYKASDGIRFTLVDTWGMTFVKMLSQQTLTPAGGAWGFAALENSGYLLQNVYLQTF